MMQTKSGTLYIVATPIGNLADISLRAIEILKTVKVIAAEDTRHSKKLLQHYLIHTPLISLHAHNEAERVEEILARLQNGEDVAVISDAGTPLISDPGQILVQKAKEMQIKVSPIPGACALIAALSVSGLPGTEFIFEGFLSTKTGVRKKIIRSLKAETRTWICYEAPHRIVDLIDELSEILGEKRFVVIARELTKTFETIKGASLKELKMWLQNDAHQQKGEFVVMVKGEECITQEELAPEVLHVLNVLLKELPKKQAVLLAEQITGAKKNKLYEYALSQPES